MPETLQNGIIVDSSLSLQQALSLRQTIEPSKEVLDRLGIADVTYYSFDGKLHQGQVVLDRELLPDVKQAFALITRLKFPINSVVPAMDRNFMSDEEKKQTENNSIGFNYRKIAGEDRFSNHSFGRAIDINPLFNPYIKGEHSYGLDYDPNRLGTLTAGSEIVEFFKQRGWVWGGDWEDHKDYMHFEKPDKRVIPAEGSNVFEVEADHSVSKEQYYSEVLSGETPDAFFVLGGGNRAIEGKSGKRYTTSPYRGKFYPEKTGGAKARPVAAAELAGFYPHAKIVTMSHRPSVLFQSAEQENQPTNSPSFASVLEGDLKRLGVKNEIVQASQSTSTLTEVMQVISLSVANGFRSAAVVTNDYQIERAQKILDILIDDDKRILLKNQLQFLFKAGEESEKFNKKWTAFEASVKEYLSEGYNLVFVPAEDVLARRSPHYQTLVTRLKEEEGYKNVGEQERVGNERIGKWEYNFAQPSFKEFILES